MNDLMNTSQSSPVAIAGSKNVTIRELSTEQRTELIERVFARLTSIYGREFAYKWESSDSNDMAAAWASALAGFDERALNSALRSCYSVPKCPNLPEFVAMCRHARIFRPQSSLALDAKPADKAKIMNMIAEVAARFGRSDGPATFAINGVPVTPGLRWAFALIQREADGDILRADAACAWRDVFGYGRDVTASVAMASRSEIALAQEPNAGVQAAPRSGVEPGTQS